MDSVILHILDQLNQIYTRALEAPVLPPASFVDIVGDASPAPSYLLPTTGDPITVERNVYTELDAVIGLQGNLVGVDQLTLPNGYTGKLYPLRYGCFATDDGSVIYWDPATSSLKKMNIDPEGGRVMSLTDTGYGLPWGSAVVYLSGEAPTLHFWFRYDSSDSVWTPVPESTLVPNGTGFFTLNEVQVPATQSTDGGHYFLARYPDRVYHWRGTTEPAQIINEFSLSRWNGFMTPMTPWLVGSNMFLDVTRDDCTPKTFQSFGTDGSETWVTPSSVLFGGSNSTPLVAVGTGGESYIAIPPPVSQQQATLIFAPEAQIFQCVNIDTILGIGSWGIYGTSFVAMSMGTTWFIGGQRRPAGSEVSFPMLLAAYGFRNFHPLTHSAWSEEAGGKFLSGFPIQDSAHADQSCTLMVLEKGNGSHVVLEIRIDANASQIPIPQVTQPVGVRRMFYPGRLLPYSQPGGEGGGGN